MEGSIPPVEYQSRRKRGIIMGLIETVEPQSLGIAPIARDEIAAHIQLSWDELFGMDRTEVESFQLRSARRRFDELAPEVKFLKTQVDATGVTAIRSLEDLVPLLFEGAVYKSYPISLIE